MTGDATDYWQAAMAELAADLGAMGALEDVHFVLPWRAPRRYSGEPIRLEWDGTQWSVSAEVDWGRRLTLSTSTDFGEARAALVREVQQLLPPRRRWTWPWAARGRSR